MNTPNNRRRKESQNKIQTALIQLLQENDLEQITVTSICKAAKVNRSTFYANYLDLYDLADSVQKRLEEDVFGLYREEREQGYNSKDYLKLFRHIKENQLFYKTYFKLGMDGRFQITQYDVHLASAYYQNQNIEYHMEFFRGGLNAIIKKWLQNDCRESPEEMFAVLQAEYMIDKK